MLFVSFRYFKGSRHSTVGLTYSREHKITAEMPSLVKKIMVISGQQVRQGDLLIELSSNSLEMEMAKITNLIQALQSERTEKMKLADSEIAFIRADEGIAVEELNTEIDQAESELRMNRKLTRDFIASKDSVSNEEPIRQKLTSLKKQRDRQNEAIAIKVKDIKQESETEQRILSNNIELHQRELALMNNEKKELNKYAAADGIVGNVFIRQGEQVDAYTALLSINLVHPTTVIGYQSGKREEIEVGSKVEIISFDNNTVRTTGKVIGYGAVVELPEILQKSTAVKAFGREVFIDIQVKNKFATGEKVLIR
jgi:HlyD family secretion protein